MEQIEVFTFEVRPYVYGSPIDTMSKTLKIMAQVNGKQFFSERVMPNQPANKTEIEYYTDMAVRMLHGLMNDADNDKAAQELKAHAATAAALKLKQE